MHWTLIDWMYLLLLLLLLWCAEIVAGILLGPTAFGLIPAFTENIFPQSSLGILETLANVGLIFFLFLVGLELDIHKLRK